MKKRKNKKEKFWNVPNALSLIRLIAGFIFIYLLFAGYSLWTLAIVFAVGALSDALDGNAARILKQQTKVGARLDQIIDRVFTALIVIPLLLKFLLAGQTYWIVMLILVSSREIIGVWGVVVRNIRNLDNYKVKWIGKATTFVQAFGIGVIIIQWPYAIYVVGLTCLVGIFSGLDYILDSLK